MERQMFLILVNINYNKEHMIVLSGDDLENFERSLKYDKNDISTQLTNKISKLEGCLTS